VFREVTALPENLRVRVSGPKIDGKPPRGFALTSTVYTDEPPEEAFVCPSREQGGKCDSCRACWEEKTIAYCLH
jgi:hypothetical protein